MYMRILTESKHFRQNKSINMLEILEEIAAPVLDLVGFYYTRKESDSDTQHVELK